MLTGIGALRGEGPLPCGPLWAARTSSCPRGFTAHEEPDSHSRAVRPTCLWLESNECALLPLVIPMLAQALRSHVSRSVFPPCVPAALEASAPRPCDATDGGLTPSGCTAELGIYPLLGTLAPKACPQSSCDSLAARP